MLANGLEGEPIRSVGRRSKYWLKAKPRAATPGHRHIMCRSLQILQQGLTATSKTSTHRRPLSAADSTDRRNALGKAFCRRFEAERFSGSLVQPSRDRVEPDLIDARQVHSFREVLP